MVEMTDPKISFKYLICNEEDAKFGMTVNTVGYQAIAPNCDYPVNEHPRGYYFLPENGRVLHEYQLLYILQGKGLFSADRKEHSEIEIGRGTMLLISPGAWHSYRPLPMVGWTEYFIGFQGPIFDRMLQQLGMSGCRLFEIGLDNGLVQLYKRALEVATEDKIAAQQYLSGIVMHMIGHLTSRLRNKTFSTNNLDQTVERAKIILGDRITQDVDFNALAEELHMSYSWFRKIFRDYTGYAPAKYFQLMKLRRAQYMLTNTQLSIKEIAFSLGYKSTEHFFAIFKKNTGFTPTAYRRCGRDNSGEKGEIL